MGAILSSGVGAASLACQSAICCCSLTNCCLTAGNGLNGVSARAAKFYYVILVGLGTLLALILRYEGDSLNLNLGAWEVHCSSTDDERDIGPSVYGQGVLTEEHYVYCKGDAAVFRISFVLSCFFAFMTISSVTGGGFHRGWWGLKLLGIFIGLLVCFFIPNSFFDNTGWAWIARIGSLCFLCLQILILIAFAYEWNDSWVSKAFPDSGEEDNSWLIAILGCAALLYLVAIAGVPLLLTFYGECGLGVGFSIVTLLGVIALTAITLFRDKIVGEEYEGAILPAAVVSAYATFLCWSALESNPDAECKPETSATSANVQMAIGIVFAVVSLCWSCLSVTDGLQGLVSGGKEEGGSATVPLYSVEGSNGSERQVDVETFESADNDVEEEEHLWVFHLTLLAASMYMAMLLTNWGADDSAHGNEDGHIGLASAWVKLCSEVLTIGLYIWTLVAPRILEDRDWA